MTILQALATLLSNDLMTTTESLRAPARWLGAQLPVLANPEDAPAADRGCVEAIRKVAQKAQELSEAIEEHRRELALWREIKLATTEEKAKGLRS